MRTVSDRWATNIASSYHLLTKVAPVSDLDNSLPFMDGSVVLDSTAANRGRCDLTFADDGTLGLIPTGADSILAPFGQELKVWRGLIYPDGEEEMVSLGVFGIEEVEVDESDEGHTIKVNGLDRAQQVADAAVEADSSIAGGTDFLTALLQMVQAGLGDVEYDFVERTAQIPTITLSEGDDRWAIAQDLAAAIGMELYFDGDGILILKPITDVQEGMAIASIIEGQGGVTVDPPPTLLTATRKWSRTNARNRWIVRGENPQTEGPAPRAVATDDNPNSPTYYYGQFGKKPDFYSSSFIGDNSQAQDAANGRKAKALGVESSVDFGSIVNPALEPGDIVRITRTRHDPLDPDNPIPIVDEDHVIDSLTIPLTADQPMTGATRAASALPIGA